MSAHPHDGGDADIDAPWMSLEPADISGLFDALAMPWWIAGSQALDLALGTSTRGASRPHVRLPIAIPRGAQPRLLALVMAGWEFFVVHEGALASWDGASLVAPQHRFWVREPGGPRWAFEVLLEEMDDTEWSYRRDPSIRRPAIEFGARTTAGIPYVAPEIVLLYKSRRPESEHNAAGFDAAERELSEASRTWLRTTLTSIEPGHPWIARL